MTDHQKIRAEINRRASEKKRLAKTRRTILISCIAPVLCLCILAGAILPGMIEKAVSPFPDDTYPSGNPTPRPSDQTPIDLPPSSPLQVLPTTYEPYLLAHAVYPEFVTRPDYADYYSGKIDRETYDSLYKAWDQYEQARRDAYLQNKPDLTSFLSSSTKKILLDSGTENRIYAPLNVYMALAMLAEVTNGNSRQQILDLLGAPNIDTLRAQANALWNVLYCDNGELKNILASSLWLNEDLNFRQDTVDILAKDYYASVMQGEMGSEEFNDALHSWLNEQTGGLLTDQVKDIGFSPETIFALATTVYYRAGWVKKFNPEQTFQDVFHGASGVVKCDYMKSTFDGSYYWGDQFSAVSFDLGGQNSMWFILPDEDATVNDILAGDTLTKLFSNQTFAESRFLKIHATIPKFDVSSDLQLTGYLKELGITDVFDSAVSDFSPITDMSGLFVSSVQHAARVQIDEEGCTAAAFTVMLVDGSTISASSNEVYFTVDRPFIFVLTGYSGLPMFVGVVNQPR